MKKKTYLILSTIVACFMMTGMSLYGDSFHQDAPQKGADNHTKNISPAEAAYRAAKKELSQNPDDKAAEEKYVASVKALWEDEAKREKEMKEARTNGSAEQKALFEAEKKFHAALKAWREDVDSKDKQNAALAAQKEVFKAQKAAAPVFVLNDKIIDDLSKIDFSKMGKGSYLCSEEARKKYGDKARNGAVILKYKEEPRSSSARPKQTAAPMQRPEGQPQRPSRVPMEEMRVEHIIKAAGIGEQQKAKVKEIFAKYSPQTDALRKENNELLRGKNSGNIAKVIENNITIEQKRAAMYTELGKVISAEQVAKLYRAEMDFAKNVIQGRFSPQGQGKDSQRPPMGGERGGERMMNPDIGDMM